MNGFRLFLISACVLFVAGTLSRAAGQEQAIGGDAWQRHTMDDTSEGADGARLRDVNGDGRPDVATAWEEGGVIRAYLHPGPGRVRAPWPRVTVGEVESPEDAVFVDLDGDGAYDVVSAAEGGTRTVFIHWAPAEPDAYLDSGAWTTEPIPATVGWTRWMFVLPMHVDGKHGPDLIVGSKAPDAVVGWLEAPPDPRDMAGWRFHKLYDASWVMTLMAEDMDGDGIDDLLFSDRKDPATRGCWWIKRAEDGFVGEPNYIGGREHEVMFMTRGDPAGDGVERILACTAAQTLLIFTPGDGGWREETLALPRDAGTGKGVAIGALSPGGRPSVVVSCEHAGGKHGVMRLDWEDGVWRFSQISGIGGTKFDMVRLVDLDEDGYPDVLTCEEQEGLGVFWYENPGP